MNGCQQFWMSKNFKEMEIGVRRAKRAYTQCSEEDEPDSAAAGEQEEDEGGARVPLRRQQKRHVEEEKDVDGDSVEQIFASSAIPPWWAQISLRGVFVSALMGVLFCVVVHKLSLTTGIVPSLNVSAGLLSFFCMRAWIALIQQLGAPCKPFTRQENTVIQTCIVACYGVAYSGGFSTYLLAMDQQTSDIVSTSSSAIDTSTDVKNPGLGWMIAFMFAVGFLGLVAVVPLRKILIIDYKLAYPSGTATAVLINSFFTPSGLRTAQEQIKCLANWFSLSFLFSLFKWNFSGPQGQCGFDYFPSFGLKAYDSKFYFDFNLTYVGAGMLCPHIVNFSLLLGGVFSWAILWPLISSHAGDWYPADAGSSNLQGLYGYKVFIAIALILGDGLYNFISATCMTIVSLYNQSFKRYAVLPLRDSDKGGDESSYDEQARNDFFLKDNLSFKVAGLSYVGLAMISVGMILQIFTEMKWYYVLVSYCIAPILGFCNAYGCGMTNWSPISSYGKVFLFTFSYWAGSQGGVIVGLVSCGLVMVIVSSAADLMQDFKTGYLTLTSPKSMLASQVLGSIIGCVVAPATFWIFWKAFPIGKVDGEYPAPYAVIFREMALLGVQGFSSLPRHCLLFSASFFVLAIIINIARNCVPTRASQFIPIPMAMALPFFIGSYFAIDMCIGSVIVFVWGKLNSRKADICIPAVASGLMCGDGVWTLVSAILALARKQPPVCMYFIASDTFTNLTLPSY